jgi:hypothetical protein
MRLSPILFLILLTSCTLKNKSESSSDFGQDLIDIGFLRFADSTKLDSLKSEIISSFYIYDEANFKIAHIDAEELAEFNFSFFVPTLKKMLEKRGLKLEVQTAEDYETTNDILINGKKIRLYSKEDLNNALFWESGANNFFREINNQLKQHGTEESFYLLYSGNDLRAMLLTKKEQEIIAKKYKGTPFEIPYLPK